MVLSNTVTPKYYAAFREKVIAGEIPVNEFISLEMNRIDRLIEDKRFYFDTEAIDGWVNYCETECTLTDGGPVNVLPSFKLWAEQLFGWYYYTWRDVFIPNDTGSGGRFEKRKVLLRLTNKQYIILGRGGAKSMYSSYVQSYLLNVDTTTTHQVATAPTMRQAEETLSPIRTAITRASGPLFKFLTMGSKHNTTGNKADRQQLVSTKKGIENHLTGSVLEIRPMTVDKLQGLRSKYNTVDEWLSGETREDPVTALEQGASKNDNWIIVLTSSEGTIRNGVGDDMKMELESILRGDYYNPHVSIWHYRLDDVSEVDNPDMWVKANPNLGYTVSYEVYKQDVKKAENSPSARNDILAKRFGIPTEGYTYFFPYEETLPHPKASFWGMQCSLGIDLSHGDDFCAFTFLFPLRGDKFGVKTRSYITQLTYDKLPPALKLKYQEFIEEDSLQIMDGDLLDMMAVYDDLDAHIEAMAYDVSAVGYDPWNAYEFIGRWEKENGPYAIEKVIQGARTESVPLGELKDLSEQRKLLFDEELMKFAMGNSVVIEDTNGNRKLFKYRSDEKIDNFAALMDAWVAYRRLPEAFE